MQAAKELAVMTASLGQTPALRAKVNASIAIVPLQITAELDIVNAAEEDRKQFYIAQQGMTPEEKANDFPSYSLPWRRVLLYANQRRP